MLDNAPGKSGPRLPTSIVFDAAQRNSQPGLGIILGARVLAELQKIYYNSRSNDDGRLNAERMQIKNVSSAAKCLTGWTVRDNAGHVSQFSSAPT